MSMPMTMMVCVEKKGKLETLFEWAGAYFPQVGDELEISRYEGAVKRTHRGKYRVARIIWRPLLMKPGVVSESPYVQSGGGSIVLEKVD